MPRIAFTILIVILISANGYTAYVGTIGDIANVGSRFILTSFRHVSSTNESSGLFLYNPDTQDDAKVTASYGLKIPIDGDSWSIGPHSSVFINIPWEYGAQKSSQISGTGFEIISTIPIRIRMINNAAFLDDSILVFPYHELGMEYYVITPPCSGSKTYKEVKIVSASEKTDVQVTLAGNQSLLYLTLNGTDYYGEDTFQVTLDKYGVLQLVSYLDLTGTKITASTFVSVFSGCDFEYQEYMQSVNVHDFHHQAEQVVDKERLGRHFDFHNVLETTLILVVTEDGTWVRIMINDVCEHIDFLTSRNVIKRVIKENSTVMIDSSHPLLVATGSDGLNDYRYQVPLEQGIWQTVVCIDQMFEVQLYLSINSNCTDGFEVNNFPVSSKQYTSSECYDTVDNKTGRCFLTSHTFQSATGCFFIRNKCDTFLGRMVITSGIEEVFGNAMTTITPTCSTSTFQNQYQNCIENVAYTCNISSNISLDTDASTTTTTISPKASTKTTLTPSPTTTPAATPTPSPTTSTDSPTKTTTTTATPTPSPTSTASNTTTTPAAPPTPSPTTSTDSPTKTPTTATPTPSPTTSTASHTTTTTTATPQTSTASQKKGCLEVCVCYGSGAANITDEVLDKISERKKELQVDMKTLSSTVRSKTSAPDSRPSARAVGGTAGVAIMTVVFGGILLFDLPLVMTLFQHAVKFFKT